jgi:hypothetical protein
MVSPWSLGSVASGFVPGKAEHQDGELVVEQSGSPHGGQEAERDQKGMGPRHTLQMHALVTSFLQTDPTS